MEQLSGQDASFLYAETPHTPLHVGSIGIYDQSSVPGGTLRFRDILKYNAERLHLSKTLRRKVVRVPFDLDHPYWIEDKDFDLEYHIRHIALPRPADWRQLYILAARILATPLDMSKPPWEAYYVEGLDHVEGLPARCFAVITKTHHCAIDGASSVDMAELLHDLTPEPRQIPPPQQAWRGERDPEVGELMIRSFANNALQPLRFAQLLARNASGFARAMQSAADLPARAPVAAVPRTRFNRTITPHRVIGFCRFDLDEVRAMRKPVRGATVNDVVVALCGGALRRYLDAKQELPDASLVAMAPVSVRGADEKGTMGNRVAAMMISTGSHIANAKTRLAHVRASSAQSKALSAAIGARQMTDAMQFLPGSLMVMGTRFASQMGLANVQNPTYNTTVTNVPGPQVPLYSMGAKLLTTIGYGPLTDGMGLMFPVGSYCGELAVSFTACREMVPDPQFLEQCIRDSYAEMKAQLG
jgi:diacylglycerol O-acyltransferase / wax synthase